ncbi:hypothetical protein K439DRAFT_1363574, partial [Ramaria rubella]
VVSCAFSLLLAITYLFYANRLLALLIGYILRLNWWNDGCEKAWVSLESFQISLLAGRIMIKDLRYHSSNQSFRAVKCRVTWRYWIWRTRGDYIRRAGEEDAKALRLPCRVHISLQGLEWRIYNRTGVYNDILEKIQRQSDQNTTAPNGFSSSFSAASQDFTASTSDGGDPHMKSPTACEPRVYSWIKQLRETISIYIALLKPDFLELLPIDLEAVRGAIVCGNPSTPSVLVAGFSNAQGSYGVYPPRSLHDKYKTVIDMNIQNVKFDLQRNDQHRGSLVQYGRAVSRRLGRDPITSELPFSTFSRSWTDQMRYETQHKMDDTHGRVEAQKQQQRNDYAIIETILEVPQLKLTYYWDEPGVVPPIIQAEYSEGLETHDVGNGDLAPEYGIDILVNGGTVRYGPWADRQRVELQRLLFPSTYRSLEPTAILKPGDTRMYTALKIFVELRDTITLHVPFKEPSKDWQFDETKFPGSSRKRREGGWLEIHAGGNSTINYVMPWVATKDGFDAMMELHLDEVTVLSSVNDIRFLIAESARISCQLPTPLRWNNARRWTFDVSFRTPKIHVIRDHINLLADLGKDWSSGPPSDFDKWIPMHYVINTSLQDYEINLYLNDHNIISHPHARDANTLLTLRGSKLHSTAELLSVVFRPQHNMIPFWIEAPNMDLSLTLPKWNTHSMFASSRTTDFGRVGLIRVDASFLYFSETLPEYIDQLKLDIVLHHMVFMTFGWVVRHILCVRDNYFGNFTHFATLYEYVSKRNRNLPVGDPVEGKWREGKSNVFEVYLGVRIEQAVMALPAGLPGYEYSLEQSAETEQHFTADPKCMGTCAVVFQPELQVQLRTNDYSMEMSLNTSPMSISLVDDFEHNLLYESYEGVGRRKLHIDGMNILTNRLFGPQPRTSTYLCFWEIQVGAITGGASMKELRGLMAALSSFRFNFTDAVNAPASEFAIPPDPDVTFLKVNVELVDVMWSTDCARIQLYVPQGVQFDHSDLAGNSYKTVTEIRVPQTIVRALVRSKTHQESWLEAASITFDVGIDLYSAPRDWRQAAKAQADFIAAQDALTHRAQFLYEKPPEPYRNSMFLPKQTFPNSYSHRKSRRRQATDTGRKLRTRPNIASLRVFDSDEDERISEADRDARLAHSRPTTPLISNKDFDNRSISSSDESDNADITSDISDTESEPEQDEGTSVSSPSLSHYRNIVRCFNFHLDDFSAWTPSFQMIRDITFPSPANDLPDRRPLNLSNAGQQVPEPPQDGALSTTVKLIRSNHVDILLTPLCMHILHEVLRELFNSATSIELVVDSLTKGYLGDASSEKVVDIPRQDNVDAEIATFRLRILQSLMSVDEVVAPLPASSTQPDIPPVTLGNSRLISDFVFSLNGVGVSFSKLSGTPGTISRPRSTFPPKVTRQCTLVLDETKVVSAQDDLHVKLGDLSIQFLGHTSPEMTAATFDSLASLIREGVTQTKRDNRMRTARQHQIWGILQSCRSISVNDPLMQTQPSFLVQMGRPLRMRHDASWKLFMYLRHCLRFLAASHRKILLKVTSITDISFSSVQLDDLFNILHEKLAEWGVELSRRDVALLPFVQSCFLPLVQSDKSRDNDKQLPAVSFHSGKISFLIFERATPPGDVLNNSLIFGPFHLVYRLRNQRIRMLASRVAGVTAHAFTSDPDAAPTRHHVFSVVIDDICLTIHPSFIIFLQRLLPLHGKYFQRALQTPPVSYSSINSYAKGRAPDVHWEFFSEVRHLSIQAAVEGMVLEVGLTNVSLVLSVLHAIPFPRIPSRTPQRFLSGSALGKLSQLYTRVRQAQNKAAPFSSNGRDVLTSLAFTSLVLDATYRITAEYPPVFHGVLTTDSVLLSVPRSALITYRLIGEWRTQYLPNIHAMAQDLFAELDKRHRAQPSKTPIQMPKRNLYTIFEFQAAVKRVGMSLQVMHGTWFSWDVQNIVFYLRSAAADRRSPRFTFGVQLASQIIRIGGQPYEGMVEAAKTIKLALPSFRTSGRYDGNQLRSHAILDHFSLTLKPKYMDDILAVQQNLGTHFYDMLDLIAESRKNRSAPKQAGTSNFSIKYDVAFMLEGFRVGIEGPTTTLALTSSQMTGTAKNEEGLAWDFDVSNLALALSHHSLDLRSRSGFDRNLRSAYMVLDVKASSSPVISPGSKLSQALRCKVGRMHAVMSPNSIGELGDLIDHVQAEKHLRQEQRALELKEIKNKTKRVMRTFEMQKSTPSLERSSFILDKRTVLIDVADIGIAFPLSLRNEIEVEAIGSIPAFLLSIRTATFSLKRYESGHASMGSLSFQFVKQFDQSRPSQFDGDQHRSRNKLLYPEMQAEFRSGTSATTRQWQIAANVNGFILNLDPTVVDNVSSLVDVYRRGKERVDRLTVIPHTTKSDPVPKMAPSVEASYQAIRTSNILLTLAFRTGKLRLCGLEVADEQKELVLQAGDDPDAIIFPPITVWGEYRATPAAAKLSGSTDQEPSALIFRSQVHTTINRIKPSIFPFLIGFTERVEDRLRHSDRQPQASNLTISSGVSDMSSKSNKEGKEFLAPGVLHGIQVSFSLRIDSSRLELDCGHDLGVVAALHWESGGFLVTLSPRARIVHFTGTVTGLQVDLRHLKHQAGTVQTAHIDARNLAFSVSYSQTGNIEGVPAHSVSVVVDTEFGAALRFDRLQDILIFKAIFIDRLPGSVPQPSVKSPLAADNHSTNIPGFITLVLIRARHIKLLIDLGHNVAATMVDLETLVLRSRFTGPVTDISLTIAQTNIDLVEDRPLAGHMRLPNFSFATVRRSDVRLGMKDSMSKMLDVSIASGTLDIVLQSEKRTLLQYHAKPFDIHIGDDWTAIDWDLPPEERTLRLDFSVAGVDILAVANLQSVPRIITLLAKLRSDLTEQRTDAMSALATSSIAQLPKPESALSEVADAMIRSARSKFSNGPAFSYILVQRMRLKLLSLRVALFKNPNDTEMALFEGRDVHAELERVLQSHDVPPSRSLKLAFSSLYLSKYTSLKYRAIGDELLAIPWLERLLKGASEWTIARVPAMNLEMNSDVEYEGRQEVLLYDLVATADERAQSSRSIYVSLNLSLYIWAGALVKGLGLEIDKALVSSGFNKPKVRTAAVTVASPPPLSSPGVS